MMPRTSLLAVLLLTGALCAAPLEPRSDHGEKCRNTVQGRSHLLDEKGWLCTLDSIDWETGCCPPARAAEEQYSCRSCEPDINCCTVYEHCVGCCLKPSNDGQRKAAMAAARHKKTFEKAVAAGDDFEFCRASCRTSSMSTVHGNAFVTDHKYCLSPVPVKLAKLPTEIETLVAAQGDSCDTACAKKDMHCDARFIASINNCEMLAKHFPCEKTKCSKNYGHDQPAYVSNKANSIFGSCLVNDKEAYYSCSGSHPDTSRLCPCRKGKSNFAPKPKL